MFVTRMLRYGNPESHSYILGCYTSYAQAVFAGEVEQSWRGGKYEYEVTEHQIDTCSPVEHVDHHRGSTEWPISFSQVTTPPFLGLLFCKRSKNLLKNII